MHQQLDRAFMALADPTRRAILSHLLKGPATVNQLAKPLPISQPSVSRHLKVLTEAGLVIRSQSATSRPAKVSGNTLALIAAWLEEYRPVWEENFQRLDTVLAGMAATQPEQETLGDKKA